MVPLVVPGTVGTVTARLGRWAVGEGNGWSRQSPVASPTVRGTVTVLMVTTAVGGTASIPGLLLIDARVEHPGIVNDIV